MFELFTGNKGANNVKDFFSTSLKKQQNTTGHSIILIIDTMLRIMYREIMSYDAIIIIIIIIDLKTYFCFLSLFFFFFFFFLWTWTRRVCLCLAAVNAGV